MELHKDEVPASEVWAVVTENPDIGRVIDWYITPAASNDAYRFITGWYDRNKDELEVETRVTRWYVELPRRRMERADVDLHVEGALAGLTDIHPYRLDIKTFTPKRQEVQ